MWTDVLSSNWREQSQEAPMKVNSIEGMIEEYERRLGGMTIGFLEGLRIWCKFLNTIPKKNIFCQKFNSQIQLVLNIFSSGAGRLLQRARDTETMYFQV